jgi:hypothetical protein
MLNYLGIGFSKIFHVCLKKYTPTNMPCFMCNIFTFLDRKVSQLFTNYFTFLYIFKKYFDGSKGYAWKLWMRSRLHNIIACCSSYINSNLLNTYSNILANFLLTLNQYVQIQSFVREYVYRRQVPLLIIFKWSVQTFVFIHISGLLEKET